MHQVPRTAYLWRGKEALERLSFREGRGVGPIRMVGWSDLDELCYDKMDDL